MSIRNKLERTNEKLNNSTNKLLSIKNAFLKPLPEYKGNEVPSSGTDTSDATATQSDILKGKTAYVKGTKLIGTHECESASVTIQEKTVTPSTIPLTVTPDNGKYLSKVTVNAVTSAIDSNIKSENIKSGVSILGVTGSYVATGGGNGSGTTPTTVTLTTGDVITYPPLPVRGTAWFIVKNTGSKNQYELYSTLFEWGYWQNDKYYCVKQNGTELENSYNYPYMLYVLPIDTPNGEWQFSGSGTASTKASSYYAKASNKDIYTWTNLVTKTENIHFAKNTD